MECDLEQNNKKIITLSFVVAAFLSFLVIRVIFETLAVSVGIVGKYWAITAFQHGVPVAGAFVTFLILQLNSNFVRWADEVVTESKKVVWPTRKDTTAMTVVTCIMLVVAGVVLGIFDVTSSQIVKVLLNL